MTFDTTMNSQSINKVAANQVKMELNKNSKTN